MMKIWTEKKIEYLFWDNAGNKLKLHNTNILKADLETFLKIRKQRRAACLDKLRVDVKKPCPTLALIQSHKYVTTYIIINTGYVPEDRKMQSIQRKNRKTNEAVHQESD